MKYAPLYEFLTGKKPGILRASLAVVCSCALLAIGTACAGKTSGGTGATSEEGDRFVRLERSSGLSRSLTLNHPLRLSGEQWAVILKSIQIQPRAERFPFVVTKGPVTAAFTEDEIEYLSSALSKTMAEARPDEIVVFGLSSQRSPQLIAMTTGGWLVTNSSLHFLLANYREMVSLPNIRQLLREEPLRSQNSDTYDVVPGPHMALIQGDDPGGHLFSLRVPELAIAYQSLITGSGWRPIGEQPGMQPSSSPSSTATSQGQPSLEERLRKLRQLRDQDLITDEDYRLKKQQLLESL